MKLPRHARGILDLRSRWRHLDHDPDAVVFEQWPNRVTPLVVMGRADGEAVGCRKIGPAF
jgi:hypothetical protein